MNGDYSAIKCFVFFPDCEIPTFPNILYLTLGENTYNTVISDIHHDDDGVRTESDWNPLDGIDKTNIYNESQGLAMAMNRITTGFYNGTSYFTSYKYPQEMRYDILSSLPEAFKLAIKISIEKNDADNITEYDALASNNYAADHGVSSTMVSLASGNIPCLTVGHFYDVGAKQQLDSKIYPITSYEYTTVGFGFILNGFLFYIVGYHDVTTNIITFRVRVLHSSVGYDFIGPSQFNANIGPISRNEYCNNNGVMGGINGLTPFQRALFKVAADRVVLAPMIYSIYGKKIPEMIIGATHDKLAFASLAIVNVEEEVNICNFVYPANYPLSLGCIYARTVLRELTEKILNKIILNSITSSDGQAVAAIDAATLGNDKEAIVLSIPRTSNPAVIEQQKKTAEIATRQKELTIKAELISTTIQNLRNVIVLFTAITNTRISRSFNDKIDDIINLVRVIINTGHYNDFNDQIFTPTIILLTIVKTDPSYMTTDEFKTYFHDLKGFIDYIIINTLIPEEEENLREQQELFNNEQRMNGGVGKYKEKSRKTKSRKTKSRKTKYHKQKLSKCLDKSQIGKKRLNCLRKMYQNNINKF
jgi:hypothetical protein